jgi:Icc-related predicted phosphoesterase
MIAILGDIHGAFEVLEDRAVKAHEAGANALIQVGDFGYYDGVINRLFQYKLPLPVYWIDGNHEQHALFLDADDLVEIHNNCFFVPRGRVLTIDGRTIAFMGGAASIDKNIRLIYGMHWSDKENIRQQDVDRLLFELGQNNNKVDMLITHVPPQNVIQGNFSKDALQFFGVPMDWRDQNADIVQNIWDSLGNPQMYCGHMHRSVIDGKCRILDEFEMILV